MALSEYVINFNYKQAIAKADELDAAAAKLEADAVAEMDFAELALLFSV